MLFLPEGLGRKSEGGMRTRGYFKKSHSNRPLITIITVVFNGGEFLEDAIKSVIEQSYDNIEYIIIDGGSSDNTIDILKKYDFAIDYWVSEKDSGIYDAFNKAISVASGDFYNIIGSDDVLFKDSVRQLVNSRLLGEDVDFIVAGMYLGDKLRIGMWPDKGWLGAHAMITGHSVGLIVSTSVHNKIGLYSTAFRLSSDALFIKKLFSSGCRGVKSDVVMGRFSSDGASNSNLALGLCEGFLVQLQTEKFKFLQVIIFIARLLKNILVICKS